MVRAIGILIVEQLNIDPKRRRRQPRLIEPFGVCSLTSLVVAIAHYKRALVVHQLTYRRYWMDGESPPSLSRGREEHGPSCPA